jgi:cytochrome b pre-mRNA-processing protein 3
MGNVFFGLLAALSEAMDRHDLVALQSVLSRNIYDGADGPQVHAMADYLMRQDTFVASQSAESVTGGKIDFESPK